MESDFYQDREQTAVKHRALRRYLSGAIPIISTWAQDICYVDCLAGPWKSVSEQLQDTSFAIAVSALQEERSRLEAQGTPPSMRCLFVENDPNAFAKLREYCNSVHDIEVTPKKWDFATSVQDIVTFIRQRINTFAFVFVDPKGWELAGIDLIRPLLTVRPNEVLITLMTSFIRRFLSDPNQSAGRLLGNTQAAKQFSVIRNLHGDEQEEELVRLYSDALREAGSFDYVCTLPVMMPDRDAMHYYLVYGTRHPRGVEKFKEMENHTISFMHEIRAQAQERRRLEATGQYSLMPPAATYREQRFTRLNMRSLRIAQDCLKNALKRKKRMQYDEAWGITMQFSTVTQDDLRGFIEQWRRDGFLEVKQLQPRQRVLQRGKNNLLCVKNGG